ncbi:MAG: damage-inducible protein CinA [Rhodobacteraceae bacterium]|nr:MAG: damage-inducible protein CinA [Paracoccaceae bacterium]
MENHKIILNEIIQKCSDKNLLITSVESCTGGLISSAITDIPGSSKVFDKGLVTYSNYSKIKLLDVPEELIIKYGAVSKEVITKMAVNPVIQAKQRNQITIATSGVAGPDKSEKKPVGLIWLATYRCDSLLIKKIEFGNLDRTIIRKKTVLEALKLLKTNLTN